MGILPWDLGPGFGFGFVAPARNPRLTVWREYPGSDSPPDEVTFRLSPSYGLLTARESHEWFLEMMREHEEFEVETDKPEEWPVPFWSETVRQVVVE